MNDKTLYVVMFRKPKGKWQVAHTESFSTKDSDATAEKVPIAYTNIRRAKSICRQLATVWDEEFRVVTVRFKLGGRG